MDTRSVGRPKIPHPRNIRVTVCFLAEEITRLRAIKTDTETLSEVIRTRALATLAPVVAPPPALAAPAPTPPVVPPRRPGVNTGLTARILAYAQEQNAPCSGAEVAHALGQNTKAVHQALVRLVAQGVLQREGAQKAARYRWVGPA